MSTRRQLRSHQFRIPARGEDVQTRSSQPEAIASTEREAYQTLLVRAHRRTGDVPPESIVRQVLSLAM